MSVVVFLGVFLQTEMFCLGCCFFSIYRMSLRCALLRCQMNRRASQWFLLQLLHFTILPLLSLNLLWPLSPRLQTAQVTHPLSLSHQQMTLKRREPRDWQSSKNRSVTRNDSRCVLIFLSRPSYPLLRIVLFS